MREWDVLNDPLVHHIAAPNSEQSYTCFHDLIFIKQPQHALIQK